MVTAQTRRFWIVLLVVGLLCLAAAGAALAQSPEATPEAQPQPRPECGVCHIDVTASWQTSTHAQAYFDVDFQNSWRRQGVDSSCLECHTTGFVPRTGKFDHQGVTCAACHGETPTNHPGEPVPIQSDEEMCADCHPTTINEWERSEHSAQFVCADCHQTHPQTIKAESSDALCTNCHTESRTDYAHASHPETACVDCHWHRSAENPDHPITGELLATGHDGLVEANTCSDCHAELDPSWAVSSSITFVIPEETAAVNPDLPQSPVETSTPDFFYTGFGIFIGSLSGILLVMGLVGLLRRR